MLRLQKIQVRLDKPLFYFHDHVILSISVQKSIKKTQKPARIITQKYIFWRQSLAIPLVEDKKYTIQIQNTNEDQRDNEQNHILLRGAMDFIDFKDDKGNWDIYTTNNQRIGKLVAIIIKKTHNVARDILKHTKNTTILSNIEPKPRKVLRILSLLAKIPNSNMKKGYFCIQIGQQVIKTPQLRSRSNQLVFIEARQVQLQKQDTSAQIKIFGIKPQQQECCLAQATLFFDNQKLTKRLSLVKDTFEVGEIYVQSRIVDKSTINTSNYVQNINKLKETSTIVNQTQQPQVNQRYKSINPSKSIDYGDYSRLNNYGIKSSRLSRQSKIDSSMISTISARRRNSVLNQNASIIFPKEKRFMIYQDRQNQKITYLNQHQRSFQFKYTKSGSRYRGASFGYGDRVDFSKGEINPGVGNYKLPSIWDRY